MPTFEVNLPEIYFAKLKADGGFAFLTSLPVNGKPKIVEIKVSLLESKEFIYSAARVKKPRDRKVGGKA